MAARIVTVSPGVIWRPDEAERLWFFPDGSDYLKYSPHFHVVFKGGFRQNFPLCHMFVIVLEGKLSVKNFYGETTHRVDVRDQVWFLRGQQKKTPYLYARAVHPQVHPAFHDYKTEAQWIREVR